MRPAPLAYDKPLCASLDGFTLHAATRAAAFDVAGKEALLRYVLRPPLAQERVEHRPDGLVRIALARAFAEGTVAVEMDPLSLLCRLAAAVPPPRYHTVKYAGVLASASPWRRRIAPRPQPVVADGCSACTAPPVDEPSPAKKTKGGPNTYRAWADLLRRTFAIDVLECPTCKGRMKLVAIGDRAREHRPLPRSPRRADERARALARARPAPLQEHGPAPQGARPPGVITP